MLVSRKRFTRVLIILILFYKTYLSRLNLAVFSTLLDTSSSFALNLNTSLALASLEDCINIVNASNEIIFNKAFASKSEKKKKEKEREDEKIVNENKKEEKKVNKKRRRIESFVEIERSK